MKRPPRRRLTPGLLRLLREADGNDGSKILLAGLALVLVLCLVLPDRPNIFTVDVSTETVGFTAIDPTLLQWELGGARLLSDPFQPSETAEVLASNTILEIAPGTRVRLQRHGIGVLRIELAAGANGGSVGVLEAPESDPRALNDWALFLVAVEERPRLLPFRGRLTVGDDVAAGVDSVLLSGSVRVVEEQLFGGSRYVARTAALDAGDRLRFQIRDPRTGNWQPAVVDGFVRAEPLTGFSEPVNALRLVAHGQADHVQVDRLGSAGYRIQAPHWARFVNDPVLAALTAVAALLVLLIEFFSRCLLQLLSLPLLLLASRGKSEEANRESKEDQG